MRSDLGSPALAKVREAVMGPNGNNLDGSCERSLAQIFAKKIAFRFVKIRESLTCTALLRSDTDIQTFLFIQIQSTAFLPLGFAPPWLPWTTT